MSPFLQSVNYIIARAKAIEFRAKELSYGWEPANNERTVRFIGGDGQSELSDSQISRIEIEL